MAYVPNVPRTVKPPTRAITTPPERTTRTNDGRAFVPNAGASSPTSNRPVTTGTAAGAKPDRYAYLDEEYGKYFSQIQQDFADRGLLDSTNKMQPMSELASAYAAARAREKRADDAQRLAREQYQTQSDLAYRQDARASSQQPIDNAMKLWEMLTGENLANSANRLSAGMDYDYKGVAQPSIFGSVFNQPYLPPLKSSGGPIGDAPVQERRPTITRPLGVDTARGEVVPTYTESGPNYAYRDQRADAEAQRSIQNAYLKLAQEQDSRAAKSAASESDPWTLMADTIVANRMAGLDETPGDNMYPTQLFNTFKASYGIDLEELIRNGDERAEALVRSAYGDPAYADRVIARIKGIAEAQKVPWRSFHQESGAMPTGGRSPMPTTTNYYSYPGAFPFPSK